MRGGGGEVTLLTLQAICSHLAAQALIIPNSGWRTTDVSNFPKVKEPLSGINEIDKLDREGRSQRCLPLLFICGNPGALIYCTNVCAQHANTCL